MKIFNRKKENKNDFSPVQMASGIRYNHPFSTLNNYIPLSGGQYSLYTSLREAVPIIDAAILKTVRLVGTFNIESKNKILENEINSFLKNIQVNSCSTGINSFLTSYLDQMITYGTAVGEIVLSKNMQNIKALYNASLEDVELKTSENPLDLVVCTRNTLNEIEPVAHQNLILITPLNPTPNEIAGTSILKGLPFVSSVLLKIINTIGVNWERLGNIRFAVTYNPSSDPTGQAFTRERVEQIASEWSKTMREKGEVSDFISVGDINIRAIGADNQILDSEVPTKQLLEQIIAKMGLPPFLLGLSWSSTERMSSQQADILTSELEHYRELLNPVIKKICDYFLILNNYNSDFEIVWDNINLQDETQLAQARYTNAQALEIEQNLLNEVDNASTNN